MVDVNVIIDNVTIKIYRNMYVVNALLHKSFPNKYLSRYKSDSLDYQCQVRLQYRIDRSQIKWCDPQPVKSKQGTTWIQSINATTTGFDLVSY